MPICQTLCTGIVHLFLAASFLRARHALSYGWPDSNHVSVTPSCLLFLVNKSLWFKKVCKVDAVGVSIYE